MEILVKDETFAGKILDEIMLEIERERLTVAELIEAKVAQELHKHQQIQAKQAEGYQQAVEQTLNPSAKKTMNHKLPDLEQEVYRALEAFQRNQMIITVNDRQVESLEQEILFDSGTEVSFMQLMPLVGG